MTYVPEREYLRKLTGKAVALVGNAASIQGTRAGVDIEAHDVVARVNWGAPTPTALHPDAGKRTDVLYHLLRYGSGPVDAEDVQRWVESDVGIVVSSRPRRHRRCLQFAPMAAEFGQRWTGCESARDVIRAELGYATVPNTGAIALAHLLRTNAQSITLYGFDFYQTGHWAGQRGETPEQAAAHVGGTAGHNQDVHRRWFRRMVALHPDRLRLHPSVALALMVDVA